MHLIYKIFNNETIRTVWDKKEEKYYISVVDIEGMFRIIEPISSKNVEPVKMSLLILLLLCKNLLICIEKRGYDEVWIVKRIALKKKP